MAIALLIRRWPDNSSLESLKAFIQTANGAIQSLQCQRIHA
ncbi:MAG: hypothetical protein QG667_1729, partial [Pseudomonadota bacterium]|nr:hypothetical protein [Pseudomonadota bacterium]